MSPNYCIAEDCEERITHGELCEQHGQEERAARDRAEAAYEDHINRLLDERRGK